MRIKLDENLGLRGQAALRAAGHDVQTARDEGLCGRPDDAIRQACIQEQRLLVTLDLDFADPRRFPPELTAGVVVIRFGQRTTPADYDHAILDLIAALAARPVEGRLWVMGGGRIREFHPHA